MHQSHLPRQKLNSHTCILSVFFSTFSYDFFFTRTCHNFTGNNKISELPGDLLMTLTNLVDVQLFKNKLTEVPVEIGSLFSLRRLSLASNNIKRSDKSNDILPLFSHSFTSVYLFHKYSLPDEIGGCTALQELYLNNNAKFSRLPATTGHLQMLRELSIRKCPALKDLPSTMAVDKDRGPASGD